MSRAISGHLPAIVVIVLCWVLAGDGSTSQGQSGNTARGTLARESGLTAEQFDRLVTELSNWGRWGADDELGTLNLITPAKRAQSGALVKAGVTVSLSHDITKASLATKAAFQRGFANIFAIGGPEYGQKFDFVEEQHQIGYHVSPMTHLDALCHVAWDGMTYNGRRFRETVSVANGCVKNAVAPMKQGIATRGVLVDIESRGRVGREDIEAWEKKTNLRISAGDALVLRKTRNGGYDLRSVMPWLKERDVAMLLADGTVETGSVPGRTTLPVHVFTLVSLGMPLVDGIDLNAVAEAAGRLNRLDFLFVVAPLPVQNGVGSAVNPIALF
jgi:putative cyclase